MNDFGKFSEWFLSLEEAERDRLMKDTIFTTLLEKQEFLTAALLAEDLLARKV